MIENNNIFSSNSMIRMHGSMDDIIDDIDDIIIIETNRSLGGTKEDKWDVTDLIGYQNNVKEIKTMIINNSINDLKKMFTKHPELLLRESVMYNALKNGSDQVVILFVKLGAILPSWCYPFPTHRINLLHAIGINICHEGCKHGRPTQKEIGMVAFNKVKFRLMEICIALQDLELDANRLMYIVYFDGLPFTNQIPLHLFWKLVTTVKHFHDRQRKSLENFFNEKQQQKIKRKYKNTKIQKYKR
ncbi:MAG: hypothetical protein WD512_10890 [Candidatus Paceibacterota bacterium]